MEVNLATRRTTQGEGLVRKKYVNMQLNRLFPSSPKSLLQSESKCEIFVMVISFNFNMNEN